MADEQQGEQQGEEKVRPEGGRARVAGGIESTGSPAAGPGSVDVSAADLDVEGGPRQESGSAIDAGDHTGGAAEAGGTGGVNAGGAG